MQVNVKERRVLHLSVIDISFNRLEDALGILLLHHLGQDIQLLIVKFLTDHLDHDLFVFLHFKFQIDGALIKLESVLPLDKFSGIGVFGRLDNLSILGICLSIENILQDRVVEDDWLLHYQRNGFSKVMKVIILDVLVI